MIQTNTLAGPDHTESTLAFSHISHLLLPEQRYEPFGQSVKSILTTSHSKRGINVNLISKQVPTLFKYLHQQLAMGANVYSPYGEYGNLSFLLQGLILGALFARVCLLTLHSFTVFILICRSKCYRSAWIRSVLEL